MRRAALAAALATGLALLPAVALAGGDVEEMLEETATAEFHGTGIVLCTWGSDSAGSSYEVTRASGMSMVEGPGGATMSYGAVAAVRSGTDWSGTEVEEWATWSVAERYTLGESRDTVRLGRPAVAMTVLDEGAPRIRLVLDAVTRVPLSTEILDGDGRVFRMSVLVTFDPGTQDLMDDMPEMDDMDMVRPMATVDAFPEVLHGYRRADVYAAGSDAVQAFYTDGVFSFSVFEAPRGKQPEAFATSTEFSRDGRTYRRIITPTSVWVHWDAPDHTYLLIGDLPPDHLLTVLDRLPEPGKRGFLVRLWRSLFG